MQNIPQIARERLNAATPVDHHLDADVLTAFAELSLPEVERTAVLDHLARCGKCRDVLVLALPEADAVQTVVAPARSGWLTWPVLRWGFVVAGAVAIVSIGILQYQRHLQPATMVAKQTTNAPALANNVQAEPAPPAFAAPSEKQGNSVAEAGSSVGKPSGRIGSESNQRKLVVPAATPQASVQQQRSSGGIGGTAARGQLLHDPGMPTQWQQQQVARAQASPAAAPSAGAMQQNTDLTQDQDSQIQAQSGQPQQESDYLSGAIGKAKPAAGAQSENAVSGQAIAGTAAQQSSSRLTLTQPSQAAPVPPIWSISPAGGLQRSFDQGQTWQDVDVNASSAPASSEIGLAVVAKNARVSDAVADKKVRKEQAGVPSFHAVTTIGTEVWAGGSNGALYHSLDAGNHWTQVMPSVEGTSLTGDIVGLAFSDAQHGKITTSTSEAWITGDSGQTWQKQ